MKYVELTEVPQYGWLTWKGVAYGARQRLNMLGAFKTSQDGQIVYVCGSAVALPAWKIISFEPVTR